MSEMMDRLHKIREDHHEKVKGRPLAELAHRFPDRCAHCGHRLPRTRRSPHAPPPRDMYTVVRMASEQGRVKTALESPACRKCRKRTVFELIN